MKKIILAVGAHPDDIDISCAGTVAKYIAEGTEVYYLVLTNGSKGSENLKISTKVLIKLRKKEQQKSADFLGVKKVFFLNFVDGELQNTPALRKQIVKIIRRVKPTTVICWDPTLFYDETLNMVNHPDHRIGAEAVIDSVYPFARNARTFPELLKEGLKPHVVEELLIFNFSKANYFVDISKTIGKKIEAISCHKSQFADIAKFAERIKMMTGLMGQKAKPPVQYAEGFIQIILRKPA
ncbi:PIG-L family deacetylase [Candidatus Daviesbacteria bacterium]|nr:PIG-L family deacetylase [Candidatus Daviesbacteria bacterium]